MKSRRKRYVRFRLHMDGPPVSDKQLASAVRMSLLSIYGEVEVADSRFFLNEYDESSGLGILQCNAASLDNLITSAVLLSSIDGTRVSFEPKRTSGTIRALKKRAT
ncbi:MAG: Rpp14/Pop5 family protein [Candidatus Hermodarchaeota archaeon]